MNAAETMDLLLSVERELPVDTWQVDGVDAWPVARMLVYMTLYQLAATDPPATAGEQSLLTRARHAARELARTVAEERRAQKADPQHGERHADAVFLSWSTSRSFPTAGRWYDMTCQPVIELLAERGRRSILWEIAPGREYRLPRSFPSHFITARAAALSYAALAWPMRSLALPGFADVAARLAQHGFQLAPPLGQALRFVRLLANRFKRGLLASRARAGFAVNYYDPMGMAFVLACREVGIPSFDLQHGVQGPLHAGYGQWSRVPRAGYAVLPSVFWTWSEAEASTIRAWAGEHGPHQVFAGGNLLLARFLRGGDDPMVRDFDQRIAPLAASAERNILVTLQPGLRIDLVLQAIRTSPPNWRWWLRLHPAMMRDRALVEAKLADVRDRVYLDEALLPLYALLRHMDVHVTESSSTVLEADLFGVPSITYHPDSVLLFGERTQCVDSADALRDAVAAARRSAPGSAMATDAAQLAAFLEART